MCRTMPTLVQIFVYTIFNRGTGSCLGKYFGLRGDHMCNLDVSVISAASGGALNRMLFGGGQS